MENFRFNNCIIEFLPKMQRSKTRNHSEERLLCNFSAAIIVTSRKIYIAILFYIRCFIDLNDAIFRYYLRYWFLIDYAHVKKSITCKTLCVHLKTWSQVIKRGIDIQSDCKKCLQEIVQFATFIFFSLCPLSYITLFKFVIRPVNDNLFTLCFFQNEVLFRMVINLANAYLNIINDNCHSPLRSCCLQTTTLLSLQHLGLFPHSWANWRNRSFMKFQRVCFVQFQNIVEKRLIVSSLQYQ